MMAKQTTLYGIREEGKKERSKKGGIYSLEKNVISEVQVVSPL